MWDSLILSLEEEEEISFVPSATSIPQGCMYRCDNSFCEKALDHWNFASFVVKDEGEAYTENLCQQCYNERLQKQGPAAVELWITAGGRTQFLRAMWAIFYLGASKGEKSFLEMPGKEQGRSTRPLAARISPAKEVQKMKQEA